MNALQLRNITLRYGQRLLFENLSLDLHPGRCLLLCGDNGAGKSSLLRIIAGLQPARFIRFTRAPDLSPKEVARQLRTQVTYLHQQPYAFRGSVRSNLKLALPRNHARGERERLLQAAMEWAGIAHLARADAIRLSGGERQRLSLARAWLQPSPYLLLDEPTANLDAGSRERTLDLLRALLDSGRGLVIATHDPRHFPDFKSDHLTLAQGRLQLGAVERPSHSSEEAYA